MQKRATHYFLPNIANAPSAAAPPLIQLSASTDTHIPLQWGVLIFKKCSDRHATASGSTSRGVLAFIREYFLIKLHTASSFGPTNNCFVCTIMLDSPSCSRQGQHYILSHLLVRAFSQAGHRAWSIPCTSFAFHRR